MTQPLDRRTSTRSTYKIKWPDSDHAIYITVNGVVQWTAATLGSINSKNMDAALDGGVDTNDQRHIPPRRRHCLRRGRTESRIRSPGWPLMEEIRAVPACGGWHADRTDDRHRFSRKPHIPGCGSGTRRSFGNAPGSVACSTSTDATIAGLAGFQCPNVFRRHHMHNALLERKFNIRRPEGAPILSESRSEAAA